MKWETSHLFKVNFEFKLRIIILILIIWPAEFFKFYQRALFCMTKVIERENQIIKNKCNLDENFAQGSYNERMERPNKQILYIPTFKLLINLSIEHGMK
jgi:hypothetical protein